MASKKIKIEGSGEGSEPKKESKKEKKQALARMAAGTGSAHPFRRRVGALEQHG